MIVYTVSGICDGGCRTKTPVKTAYHDRSAFDVQVEHLRRVITKNHGWVHVNGRDYCPKCAALLTDHHVRDAVVTGRGETGHAD